MKSLLLGILLGMVLSVDSLWALRISRPPEFVEWTPASLAQLNNTLWQLWNVTNGRVSLDVVTANPNGSRTGEAGEVVVYNNAGSRKFCTNIGGTTWRCSANALTAP